jgi:hypothetical protein
VPLIIAGGLLYIITKPDKEEMMSTLYITTKDGSENSLAFENQVKAEVIKDAILQSCLDHRGKARK